MIFKIGDRIVCGGEVDGHYSTRGERGVVIGVFRNAPSNTPILIQFDNLIPNAHDGNGRGRYGHCLWADPNMLQLETAATPIIPASEREYITL